MPSATTPSPTLPPGSVFDIIPVLLDTLNNLISDEKLNATKDLPTQLSAVKQRIAVARATIAEMPDVGRPIEEQEEEIREIEERIAKLKAVWADVRDGVREA
ncbi:MAG: hypothetical protein MMC23_002998 [Stictis urceolatum]|nr:hypothetical protein [Stictis urceolata]